MAARAYGETTYERWIREQGLPMVGGHGVENPLDLPLAPWERLGGRGAFIKLQGMEGVTGMYVVEIPPGGTLNPERHLYEEIHYVLAGRGSAEFYNGDSSRHVSFEWQAGSLFAVPLNSWHRFFNGSGSQPAVLLAFTNAPLILDVFHKPEFVFNCDHVFDDRFDARADYFNEQDQRRLEKDGSTRWSTNFVPDVRTARLDPREYKLAGRLSTTIEMGEGVLVNHIAQLPPARHDKAHYHGGGAVLLTLDGVGYTPMWPNALGMRPYESGHGDQVERVDWREGSLVGPPSGWFHQHCNTGATPARQLAFRYGAKYSPEFHEIHRRAGTSVSVRNGGTVIEWEDEDPAVRRTFEEACARNGVESQRPRALAHSY